MRKYRTILIAFGALTWTHALFGQEGTPSEPPEEADESTEVRIVGDRVDAIQKIPGSVTVLDNKEINRAQGVNTAELLRRVPGITVREDTAGGGRLDIGIRGLDPGRSRRLLVLEDGVPLAINPYAEADLYFTPQLERYTRIEVLKGSGSILFGPQTVGGVINFNTILPPYKTESYVGVEGGQYGYGRIIGRFGTAISLRDDEDPVRLLGQVVVKGGDGARDQPFRDRDAMLKIVFPTGARGQGTLKLAAHHQEATSEDVGLTRAMFDEDPRRATLSPNSRMELARFDGVFTHEIELAPNITLKTLLYGTYTTRVWSRQQYNRLAEPGNHYQRIVGDPELPFGAIYFKDAARVLDREYYVLGLEPRLTAKFPTGPIQHTLDGGLRILTEGAQLDEFDGRAGSFEGVLDASEDHQSIAFAAYVQDRMAPTPWLVVTPGVRLEYARFLRNVEITAGGGQGGTGDSDVVTVIPGLGATMGVAEFHTFAGIHVGFAPPRISTAIGVRGDSALLDAEKSTNYEAGVRSRPLPWLFGEATFYFTRFTNQIIPNTVPGGLTELINGGATQSLGGELSTKAEIAKAAKADFDLDLGFRAGVSRATFESGASAGRVLPYAPFGTLTATLDLGYPKLGLSAGTTFTYVGKQYSDDENTVIADASGRVGVIDPYTLLDATVRYDESHTGISIFGTIKNILDQPYIIARRPEGIFTAGFRQINVGVGYAIR